MEVLQADNISKQYGTGANAVHALREISFHISQGEFAAIVGTSGSGKTTLLNLIGGLDVPTGGEIIIRGHNLAGLKRKQLTVFRRRNIGFVFQNYSLMPVLNVYDNVAFAQSVVEAPAKVIRRKVPAMLSMVGLAEKYKSYPRELSGGEQQRVALARALINNPPILLADEPTGNLDPKNSWEIMNLLDEINKRGTTVVVVTHNREIVDAMQKRVIAIQKGMVVSDERKGGYL